METEEEAHCLLELATTKRTVCEISKTLAEHRLAEAVLRTRFLRIQAEKAEKRLEAANVSVGRVRSIIRSSGHSIYPKSLRKDDSGGYKCRFNIHLFKLIVINGFESLAAPSGNYEVIPVFD